jgi:OOP family OmpA-OmpF porin
MAKVENLVMHDAAMRRFAESIFYEEQKVEEVEEVIVLRGVNFAFDSASLEPTAQSVLNEVALIVKRKPGAPVLLSGYTDHFGTDAYNLALSQRRADAVKNYLVSQGIPQSRITARGQGKSFAYDNSTEEGCYMNRRVEFVFME